MIDQDLWSEYLPGDMPEGCTYEQFCIARDSVWQQEDFDWEVGYLKLCKLLYDSTPSNETKGIMETMMTISIGKIRG